MYVVMSTNYEQPSNPLWPAYLLLCVPGGPPQASGSTELGPFHVLIITNIGPISFSLLNFLDYYLNTL